MSPRFILIILWLWGGMLHLSAESDYDKQQRLNKELSEAAYFGETDKLAELVKGPDRELIASKNMLGNAMHYALLGKQEKVVEQLLGMDYPMRHFPGLFATRGLSPEMARVLLNHLPRQSQVKPMEALDLALKKGEAEIATLLIKESGPYTPEDLQRALARSLMRNDPNLITLLLEAGADPYLGRPGQRVVDAAVQLKSLKMLELLDTKDEFKQLRKEMAAAAPPKDSPLIGLYQTPGGGASEMTLWLKEDGSGTYANAMAGGFPMAWKQRSPKQAEITASVPGQPAQTVTIEVELVEPDTVKVTAAGKSQILKRVDMDRDKREGRPPGQFPHLVRIEHAWLTPDNRLVLQVNGRYRDVPVSQLMAKESTHFSGRPNPNNVLTWESFTPDKSVVADRKKWKELAFHPRSAGTGYKSNRLAYDHTHVLELEPGVEMAIVQTRQEAYRRQPEYPQEYPQGWAVAFREPLDNGAYYVAFYFLKSETEQ